MAKQSPWIWVVCIVPIFIVIIGILVINGQSNIADHQTTHSNYCVTQLAIIKSDKASHQPSAVIVQDTQDYKDACSN